jgi:hypothetical protein
LSNLGSSWPIEENKGRIFQVWKAVAFEFLVQLEDPWSKDGIPQPTLKIPQEVKPLLTYISRLYDGEKGEELLAWNLWSHRKHTVNWRRVIGEAVVIWVVDLLSKG